MTKFIANLEVETDITLPPDIPFLCYNHSASAYTVFLRNAHEVRHDLTFLTMQVIFDAPSIQDAKAISKKLAKEFVDYLSLAWISTERNSTDATFTRRAVFESV